MLARTIPTLLVFCICLIAGRPTAAQAPDKYALLIAVTKYNHQGMNEPVSLQFPEDDARALADVLKASGYKVDLVLGSEATLKNIRTYLAGLVSKGNASGTVIVGLWGHGVEFQGDDDSMFCPYDTALRIVKQANGDPVRNKDTKEPELEPDPKTLVGMSEVLGSLKSTGAGSRLLLADCCRNSPFAARGLGKRAFGDKIKVSDLPTNTTALFSCSAGEKAFESERWGHGNYKGHGAFTKCFLDLLPTMAAEGKDVERYTGDLMDSVAELVQAASNGADKQNVYKISTGNPKLHLSIPKSNDRYVSKTTGMNLVLIPAGTFMMGSSETKEQLDAAGLKGSFTVEDESPVHTVHISRAFYLGEKEVTVGQFRKFVESAGYQTEAESDGKGGLGYNSTTQFSGQKREVNWKNTGFNQTDQHPVVNVSWNDAQAFCKWLSNQDGATYRLPTEAEWEYACRARTTTRLSSGDTAASLQGKGNFRDRSFESKFPKVDYGKFPSVPFDDRYAFTAPVGSFAPNACKLYDMHGNVWEWCQDWYSENYYKESPSTDPPGADNRSYRVFRGGSWYVGAGRCRSAYRNGYSPGNRTLNVGFRVAVGR